MQIATTKPSEAADQSPGGPVPGEIPVTLDPKKTLVPLTLLIVVLVAGFGYFSGQITASISKLGDRVGSMSQHMGQIEDRIIIIEERGRDRFSRSDAQLMMAELKALNPEIEVPVLRRR